MTKKQKLCGIKFVVKSRGNRFIEIGDAIQKQLRHCDDYVLKHRMVNVMLACDDLRRYSNHRCNLRLNKRPFNFYDLDCIEATIQMKLYEPKVIKYFAKLARTQKERAARLNKNKSKKKRPKKRSSYK